MPFAIFLPTAHTMEIAVKPGDTLFSIASRSRASESTTVWQQAIALLELNPRAFARGNVNGIRLGATLKVPTQEQAEAVDADDAAKRVREQHLRWATQSKPVEPRDDPEPALHKVIVIRGAKVEETATVIRN
jgi:pilus assembly protein FimV